MGVPDLAWSRAFGSFPDGVCVSDANGQVRYANPAAALLLGVPEAELPGKRLCDLLCANLTSLDCRECASGCPLRDSNSVQRSVTFQGGYLGSPSEPRLKRLRLSCARVPEWNGHLTFIGEVRAAPAGQKTGALGARDLRAPLTEVWMTLRDLQDMPLGHEIDPGDKKLFGVTLRACERVLELLDIDLEVARLDASALPVRIGPVSPCGLARGCMERAQATAQERGISMALGMPEDLSVLADPDLLGRVLENLLINALRVTPQGGFVSLTAAAAPWHTVEIAVQGSGAGVEPESLSGIFDRAYKARALAEERRQSLGLRWIFCQRAAHAMGGRFDILPVAGGGQRFVLRLLAS